MILFLNDPFEKKPQLAVRAKAYEDGELLHESNRNCILRHAAQFLSNYIDQDQFVVADKLLKEVWPPTGESWSATRSRYPASLSYFFTSLLMNQSHAAGENVHRAVD